MLVGHSLGGDTAAYLASQPGASFAALVTLDNRRAALPRSPMTKVLSIRAGDTQADPECCRRWTSAATPARASSRLAVRAIMTCRTRQRAAQGKDQPRHRDLLAAQPRRRSAVRVRQRFGSGMRERSTWLHCTPGFGVNWRFRFLACGEPWPSNTSSSRTTRTSGGGFIGPAPAAGGGQAGGRAVHLLRPLRPGRRPPGANHDVRPHPHIGLATVTYLFEGAMMHRDSLGSVQRIEPGAINWMTAGSGIVHSERTPPDLVGKPRRSHGLQLWAALPQEHEEDRARLSPHAGGAIPEVHVERRRRCGCWSARLRQTRRWRPSPTLYLDVALEAGGARTADAAEAAIYPVDGDLAIDGEPLAAHDGDARAGNGARMSPLAGALRGDRRRAARRPALHLLEFRLVEQERIDGRRRLGTAALREGARRNRVDPAAGAAAVVGASGIGRRHRRKGGQILPTRSSAASTAGRLRSPSGRLNRRRSPRGQKICHLNQFSRRSE